MAHAPRSFSDARDAFCCKPHGGLEPPISVPVTITSPVKEAAARQKSHFADPFCSLFLAKAMPFIRISASTGTTMSTLLIIDDERSALTKLSQIFREHGFTVLTAPSATE